MERSTVFFPRFAWRAALAAGLLAASGLAGAQIPGVTVNALQRTGLTGDEQREVVMLSVEFAPGTGLPRHTHPGDEFATILSGTVELRVDGQEARRLTAGQSYHNPRGSAHEARNVGDAPARMISVFVIDRGRPVTQPAP